MNWTKSTGVLNSNPVTPIVKYLLILNVLVFAIVYLPGEMGYDFNIAELLAMYYPGGKSFRPYQIVSHFFMHADVTHIAFNMLSRPLSVRRDCTVHRYGTK